MGNRSGATVRRWATALLVAGMGLVGSASAAVLLVDGNGELTGANGVDVGGTLYDVRFVDGTCSSVFSGCDSDSDFTFATTADAFVASRALLDQVLLDGIAGNFDTIPSLTVGCEPGAGDVGEGEICHIGTPAFAVGIMIAARNATQDDTFRISDIGEVGPADVYAVWSPAAQSVPEPSAFACLGVGLLALALARRRRTLPSCSTQ